MFKKIGFLVLALILSGNALAQTTPASPARQTPVSLEEVANFLKEAGLQVCRAEALDPKVAQWHGTTASYWLEIAENCAARKPGEDDIMHVHQFSNSEDRDRMVSSYLSNRPRGIAINASIWPVREKAAVALIGPHQAKYRNQLQQAFEARQAAKK